MPTRLVTTAIILTMAYPWAPANAQTWPNASFQSSAQLEAAEAQRRAEAQKRQDEIAQQRRDRLDQLLEPWLNQPASNPDINAPAIEAAWPPPILQTF